VRKLLESNPELLEAIEEKVRNSNHAGALDSEEPEFELDDDDDDFDFTPDRDREDE
jgi:hypothetical protein